MAEDAALLEGVPDDYEAAEEAAMEAAEEAAKEAAERAAARARQEAFEAEEDERLAARERQEAAEAEEDAMMEAEEAVEGGGAGGPKKSGKRRIIHHALDPSLLSGAAGGGAIVADEEELERRRARAAKFEMPAAEPSAASAPVAPPQLLTMEEIARREARAQKWQEAGVELKPANPLDSIATLAGDGAFWERRRDAAPDESARPEAVHIFGTDRMSTEDLLLYFVTPGVTPQVQAPQWVEWVNDSSANVVFASADAAASAVAERTIPLLPNSQGIDTTCWRTIPEEAAAAGQGKGLQLLFRLATYKDVKPPKKAPSRWYGESDRKGGNRKSSGVHDRRDARRHGAAPYGGGGGGGRSSHLSREERQEATAKAIAAANLAKEGGKRSLAETIAVRSAREAVPSLAEMASGGVRAGGAPTLADMASGAAAERRVEVAPSAPTLAEMARQSGGANPRFRPDMPAEGADLRAMLGGRRGGGRKGGGGGGGGGGEAAAASDAGGELGGTMSYAAVKAEEQQAAAQEAPPPQAADGAAAEGGAMES